jgi:acyl-CoA thioester hydrolase
MSVLIDPATVDLTSAVAAVDVAVRFAETDLMGVVHHATYVIWFEVGRVAWMSAAGMPYTEIAAGGNHFAVTGIQVAYRASAHFGDTVRIHTRLVELRSRQVKFGYELRRLADSVLIATGVSEHICVDLEGRTAKIPPTVAARLWSGAARLADEQPVRKEEPLPNEPGWPRQKGQTYLDMTLVPRLQP